MKEIFYELIEEAAKGEVIIDGDKWPIGFNTVIYENGKLAKGLFFDRNISCLTIKNEELFFKKLEEYIDLELEKNRKCLSFVHDSDRNKKKFLMAYLMVNATTEDFLNPIKYIDRTISFLEDSTLSHYDEEDLIPFQGVLDGYFFKIKNNSQGVMMETPNRMDFSIVKYIGDRELEYKLPSISYGFAPSVFGNNDCYIYSILNPKKKKEMSEEEIKFDKKISRLLYKLNSGVEIDENDNELTDITQVSPSAVLSLVSFLSLIKKEDVNEVRGVPYLPLRYLSRDIAADLKDGEERETLIERNNSIQRNVTDKFTRTFFRACYHLGEDYLMLVPYALDEFLHFKFNDVKKTNNVLLNEVVEAASSK